MTFARRLRYAFIATLSLTCLHGAFVSAHAQEPHKVQIDALRTAMEKYKDYKAAVRDLYLSTVGCVHYSGEKIPGAMEYAKGAMGVHFVNLTIKGPPDPMKPNVLIYEPVGSDLKLVAVEWLVPLDGGYQGGAVTLWSALHGSDGRARAAHSEGVPPLRPACLAVQGQPARHVRTDQPEGELQGQLCAAGEPDQDGARATPIVGEPTCSNGDLGSWSR